MEELKGVPEHKPRPRRVRGWHKLLVKRWIEHPPASFHRGQPLLPDSITIPRAHPPSHREIEHPEAMQAISPAGKHAPGSLFIWELERKNKKTNNIKSAAAEEVDKEDLKARVPSRAEEALL